MGQRGVFSVVLIGSVLVLTGLISCHKESKEPVSDYEATIRRTSFGVAHILADDWGDLGFGEGYAFASDHACDLADQVIRARGKRAKFFGPGKNNRHLETDAAVKALMIYERAEAELETEDNRIREWLEGYAAGYNQYLVETGHNKLKGWCAGADWLGEIRAVDLAAYQRLIIEGLSSLHSAIALAKPPLTQGKKVREPGAGPSSFRAPLIREKEVGLGSNGWAIGRDRSASGGGMLVANPHYPWRGSNRYWEKHLTIPGELDVYGVQLVGVPGVAVGFNRYVGWTHTVSAGERFTFYLLKLVPGDPTRYHYDGEERSMEARTVQMSVRQEDGTLTVVERTIWFSHYGPIVSMSGFEWSEDLALTVRDSNFANTESRALWLKLAMATSMEAVKQAHADHGGFPWINTIAASADGRAWYADSAATPNLTREALSLWLSRRESDESTKIMWDRGLVLLDGSDSRFEWQMADGQGSRGVVPFRELPQIERRDYVFNANDSHWVPHATARLEGYSPLTGSERSSLSLRSRMNATVLGDLSASGPSGSDGRFTRNELARAILSNRGLTEELLRKQLVARCEDHSTVTVGLDSVNLVGACQVLAAWSGRVDLESRGAVLWRETMGQFGRAALRQAGPLFAEPFDESNPIETPRGLASGNGVLVRLGQAVRLLEGEGIALDVSLGELQHTMKGKRRVSIHGGQGEYEGVLNYVRLVPNTTTLESEILPSLIPGSRFLTTAGYPITNGTSFIMVLEYTDRGPEADAMLTYSQSGDFSSPHFLDQTDRFSVKKWRAVRFERDDILADPELEVFVVRGSL